ncbi:zinc finger protein 470-like [Vespula squamosa]|uniref:Zinc finger protein 470-like n=1 Tax=Vespula squamosa TaxID=30214 RepID=A0ABD2A3D5_VESSQ
METGSSVILDTCGDDSVLLQTVKNIVNQNQHNELEPEEEEFFLVTDVENEHHRNIDVTNEDSLCNLNESLEKVSWSGLCRICANVNDHLIPIFEGEGMEHALCNKIHKYLPIHISENDTLPLQLCYHCAATLLAWHELAEGCINAERRLLEIQTSSQNKQYFQPQSTDESETLPETTISHVTEKVFPSQESEVKNEAYEKEAANNSSRSLTLLILKKLFMCHDYGLEKCPPSAFFKCTYKSGVKLRLFSRSSSNRTPFKMFLEMHNIFWKPYKKRCQLQQKKSNMGGDCGSIWIAVMDTTLEHPSIADLQQNNDTEVKGEMCEEYKQNNAKILDREQNTCMVAFLPNINNETQKTKMCKTSLMSRNHSNLLRLLCFQVWFNNEGNLCGILCNSWQPEDNSIIQISTIQVEDSKTERLQYLQCVQCEIVFTDIKCLINHMNAQHSAGMHYCSHCKLAYNGSSKAFEEHLTTHYNTTYAVSKHMRVENQIVLMEESKTESNDSEVQKEKEMNIDVSCNEQLLFTCHLCSKSYKKKSELKKHVILHDDIIQAQNRDEAELIHKAKQIINNRISYKCELCKKVIFTKRGFLRHMRVHSGKRPCKCELCGKCYRIEQDLARHIRDVHEELTEKHN